MDMIANLAKITNLKIDEKKIKYFEKQFEETLKIIDQFDELDTSKIEETYQVTGEKNVLREDVITAEKVLTQDEALSGSKRTYNGYFVVDAIFHEE